MGRQLGPDGIRFASIGYGYGSTIYAIELSNGMVKVGFSRNPRSRLHKLSYECRRRFGAEIVRFHVGAKLPDHTATKAELSLIRSMTKIADHAVPGSREYFRDTHFGAAQTLVDQVCAAFTPNREAV